MWKSSGLQQPPSGGGYFVGEMCYSICAAKVRVSRLKMCLMDETRDAQRRESARTETADCEEISSFVLMLFQHPFSVSHDSPRRSAHHRIPHW